jgi:hypothetical protein
VRLSPHPAQACPSGLITRGPTIRSGAGSWSSAGPLTATEVAASSLSIGWGVVVIVGFGAHLTTSALFRVGPRGPVSGRLSTTVSWKGLALLSWFPAAFRLPALASWSSCSRRGVGLSSRSAYRPTAGPRRGFRVSHARAAIGVGALSTPGTMVLILTAVALRPASVASQRRVPTPRRSYPSIRGSASRSINQGFKRFHPSDLPLACGPRMARAPLGFLPSFAPGPYGPRTSGWGQVIEHGPATRSTSSTSLQSCVLTQYVRPRVARDNAEAPRHRGRAARNSSTREVSVGDGRAPAWSAIRKSRGLLRHGERATAVSRTLTKPTLWVRARRQCSLHWVMSILAADRRQPPIKVQRTDGEGRQVGARVPAGTIR